MAKKLDINTKEKILKAVEHLISKTGVNNFSLRDIAKKANISLGTLYYYYDTKDKLIIDLANLYFESINKEYFDWLGRHKKDLTQDRFLDVIFNKGANFFNKGKVHLFLLNECMGGNKVLQKKYTKLYETWLDNLKVGIKQVFPKVKEVDTFASILMMSIDGMIFQELLKLDTNINEKKIKQLLKELAK